MDIQVFSLKTQFDFGALSHENMSSIPATVDWSPTCISILIIYLSSTSPTTSVTKNYLLFFRYYILSILIVSI